MNDLVLEEVVALGTPPFEAEGFSKWVGFMIEKIEEDYFCFL
jgi:hypothetical protein